MNFLDIRFIVEFLVITMTLNPQEKAFNLSEFCLFYALFVPNIIVICADL